MSNSFDKPFSSKMGSGRKAFKKNCRFLRPSKIVKNGRMIDAKSCMAYIPAFEVPEDRGVCEFCLVPDMDVNPDRCKFFSPLDVGIDMPTRWFCRLLGHKYIEPEQCNIEHCPNYIKKEGSKWEIGRPINSSDKENMQKQDAPLRKLIPKSSQLKKSGNSKKSEDSGYMAF